MGLGNYPHYFVYPPLFEHLGGYVDFIERFIESERKTFDLEYKKFSDGKKKMSYEDYQYNQYAQGGYKDRSDVLYSVYPYTLRSSILITTYSLFENELKKICDYYSKKTKQKFFVKDISGGGLLDKVQKYLYVAYGFKINLYKEWKMFTKIKKLRNTLVHDNGFFGDKSNQLHELIHEELIGFQKQQDGNNKIVLENSKINKLFMGICFNLLDYIVKEIDQSLIDNDLIPKI